MSHIAQWTHHSLPPDPRRRFFADMSLMTAQPEYGTFEYGHSPGPHGRRSRTRQTVHAPGGHDTPRDTAPVPKPPNRRRVLRHPPQLRRPAAVHRRPAPSTNAARRPRADPTPSPSSTPGPQLSTPEPTESQSTGSESRPSKIPSPCLNRLTPAHHERAGGRRNVARHGGSAMNRPNPGVIQLTPSRSHIARFPHFYRIHQKESAER